MKMYYEVKKIEQCSSCGDYLRNRRLVVYYKNEYVCQDCYMMKNHSEDKKKKEEHESRESIFEKVLKHVGIDGEARKPVQEEKEDEVKPGKKVLAPKEIVEHLNQNIIGQEAAKKTLAVAVHNHYSRVFAKENKARIPKSNVWRRSIACR